MILALFYVIRAQPAEERTYSTTHRQIPISGNRRTPAELAPRSMSGHIPNPTPSPDAPEQEPRTPIDMDEKELLDMWDEGASPPIDIAEDQLEINVVYATTELRFKIKPSTQLSKLMVAFCDRTAKAPPTVRFLYDGERIFGSLTPEDVSLLIHLHPLFILQLLTMPTVIAGYARWRYH